MEAYKETKRKVSSLSINNSIEGETIENKIERIISNNEPIEDSAPIIYTARKEGVLPAYNIRTDRWELAIDAMDKVSGSKIAEREARIKAEETANNNGESESTDDTGGEPIN